MLLPRQVSTLDANPTAKFRYPCDVPTDKYLWVEELLMAHSEAGTGVLRGLLERKKPIVVKFGPPTHLAREFQYSQMLQHIPHFVKFYCHFTCDEDAKALATRNFVVEPILCKKPGDRLGFAIMPYYPLGTINRYRWTLANLPTLRNVLKQVCASVVLAYIEHGFVHNDLHLDNILLRKSKKSSVAFGEGVSLPMHGLYAVILDFDRSFVDERRERPNKLYHCLLSLLHLAATMDDNSDLALDANDREIWKLAAQNVPVSWETLHAAWRAVDGMSIRYEKSKLPRKK